MKKLTILCACLMFVSQVQAENSWVDEAIEKEIAAETTIVQKKSRLAPSERQRDQPNIYIVNQNKSRNDLNNDNQLQNDSNSESDADSAAITRNNSQLDNQPTTFVEASPLSESRASSLRDMRQNAEIETEQKIVEKLEASRLEDERRRSQRLFGNKQFRSDYRDQSQIGHRYENTVQQREEIIKVIQVEHIKPEPPVVIEKTVIVEEPKLIATAPAAAPVATSTYEAPTPSFFSIANPYVSLGGGITAYEASNIDSNPSFSLGLGVELSENIDVEASLIHSSHTVDDVYKVSGHYNDESSVESHGVTDLTQWNVGAEARYKLNLGSNITPFIGGYIGLVNRSYSGSKDKHYKYGSKTEESTNTLNVAPIVGVGLKLNNKFSIGVDYRYMLSLAEKDSKSEKDSLSGFEEVLLEDINYSLITLKATLSF